jgi:hypothetical protein
VQALHQETFMMSQSFLSADSLLRCKLQTLDRAEAVLTDLILDTEDWRVRFLAADAVLHLSVEIGTLRDAPARPLRISGETGNGVPVIDVAS